MEFPSVVAWAEAFAEDDTAPVGLRLFSLVLLDTEPVREFIAARDAAEVGAEDE